MKYTEAIKNPLYPQWLKDAEVKDAIVEIDESGCVLWKGGTWQDGLWKGGTWQDGLWKGGTWQDGLWKDGIWKGGIWQGGIWQGGNWKGGNWKSGLWIGGTWKGGTWKGGTWKGGVWQSGQRAPVCRWNVTVDDDGIVSIGCKTGTIQEWDDWFAGSEEYETPRGTEEFDLIQANYEAIKAFHLSLTKAKEQTK